MKVSHIIIGIAAVMGFTACDFTDLTPTDKVGDSQIKTDVSTLKQSLNGVYSKASWTVTIGSTATLSDDVIKGGRTVAHMTTRTSGHTVLQRATTTTSGQATTP